MARRSEPSIEELRSPSYELLRALRHEELVEFAIEYFFRKTSWLTRLHHAMSITTLVAIVWVATGFVSALVQFGLATVTLVVVILPLHEAIHAAGYWLLGARNISWGLMPRMLAAYVVADRFVAGRGAFVFVALAPFVVLNAALLILAAAFPAFAAYFLSVLLWHIAGASGDWALLNFYWKERHREIYTVDEDGTSFFYGRVPVP